MFTRVRGLAVGLVLMLHAARRVTVSVLLVPVVSSYCFVESYMLPVM